MRVWVTRDEPRDGPLSTALRDHGLLVVCEPVLERRVVAGALDVIAQLGPDDWLVLTSPYAIEAAACEAAKTPRVAVVAQPSRRAAEAHGMRVELVSSGGDGESLFRELRGKVTSGIVCYLRSSRAAMPESWPGVDLRCPVLYETTTRAFDRGVINRVDVVSVASPSAVLAVGPLDLPFASIGPTTSAAIRNLGREPWVEAPTPSFEALAVAIAAQL
ncbi:MAG: uroporphyrinogen-III synthase [Planctomycetes bacterium]|nr:uroporphyrinogen-III synthase [Planctomycetota bacterium]